MYTNLISNLPSITFVHSTRNLMGQLANHVVRNLNILSGYIQTNVYSLAVSSLGINLSLLYLSSKIIETAAPYFKSELFKNQWIQQIAPIIFKTVFLSGGLALASQILDLKLTKAYVLINAAAVIFFQLLWKEILKKDQENVVNKTDESSDEESVSSENKPPKLDLNKLGEEDLESTPTTPTPPTGRRNKELLKTTTLENKNKGMEDAGY